ncbi:hypothetical protein [Candidatus Magnetomonas plexicatena]|uniref:hypothetical protein n=1 Tax=Candidatus Magnetomonas plexicatena TaxID=2552947 RepID=UPI001C79A677|nr:hypothetical protein E2O03_006405 [Nitrospirales bacterium LBB_01]
MAFESITDSKIEELILCEKRVINPGIKSKIKAEHEQYNYDAISLDTNKYKFMIYKRQNKREGMEDDFSCGIIWIAPSGEMLTLKRYNGPNHKHKNHLENDSLTDGAHVHIATERYIRANKKAEGFAEKTSCYITVEGALHCLVKACNVKNIQTTPDESRLF